MRKTIKKVTTVVPVLTTNCHVSEKRNRGPVSNQTMMTAKAMMKAADVPVALVALIDNRSSCWLSLLVFFRTMAEPGHLPDSITSALQHQVKGGGSDVFNEGI